MAPHTQVDFSLPVLSTSSIIQRESLDIGEIFSLYFAVIWGVTMDSTHRMVLVSGLVEDLIQELRRVASSRGFYLV